MAIFARRRLQMMLDEVARAHLDEAKCRDLIQRIEDREIDQALPAEMELAVMWAILQLGEAEIEPQWFGASSLPDAFSTSLIPAHDTVIEIAALSDAALPADEGMRNASRKLSHEAGRLRKGSARHLSYYFFEESKWTNREALRWVKVPRDLFVTPTISRTLDTWLVGQNRRQGDNVRITEGELDVLVEWHDTKQSRYNYRTSMPPEIRSVRNNYVFGALRRKAKQLRSPLFTGLRCAILCDVGSTALREVERHDHLGRVVSGGQIISAFLQQAHSGLDVVAVVTPRRQRRRLDALEETIDWRVVVFVRPGLEIDVSGMARLAEVLPPPRREGYQARQLHEQGVFSPRARGRYVPMSIRWSKNEKTTVRFSARALLDALAGRSAPAQLADMLQIERGGPNVFQLRLDKGETISAIRLEPGGPLDDDDWIVVEFADDPAARELRRAPHAEQS